MNQQEVEFFVEALENVERDENYGYIFYFYGDDHRLGFVTIAQTDNEYESISNLSRAGVFRINIGISKETYMSLIGSYDVSDIDFTVLNTFLPHPDYAKQNFICIMNPSDKNDDKVKSLITEAHNIARKRYEQRNES